MEGFEPTQYSRICSEHFLENDYFTGTRELRKGSAPSIFRFSEHLKRVINDRKPPKRRAVDSEEVQSSSNITLRIADTPSSAGSPSKEELKLEIVKQNSKIKVLKQKVRRKAKKATDLPRFCK